MSVCMCTHVLLCAPVALAFAQFALDAKQRFASKTMLFFVVKKCTEIRQGLFTGVHVLLIFKIFDFFANAHGYCSFLIFKIFDFFANAHGYCSFYLLAWREFPEIKIYVYTLLRDSHYCCLDRSHKIDEINASAVVRIIFLLACLKYLFMNAPT